ncbi:MAG: NTP transferase domain-containing protein [Clostridia bacterium]|nr:NTP transferase domain-containing protein [Clostridia bacterium]
MKKDKIAIVMAAGESEAMNSKKSKLVHKLYGKELVLRVVETAEKIDCDEIITVVGNQKEQIMEVLKDKTKYVVQEKALGTGHALMQVIPSLESKKGQVVVLYGDVPIIRKETVERLVDRNRNEREAMTLLTAISDNPSGYGRVIRNDVGEVLEIVEEKQASNEMKAIKEINSGIYCFDIEALVSSIKELKPQENGDILLTDIVKIMNDKKLKVGALIVEDNTEILGVNDRVQLELLSRVLKMRINTYHMLNGVTIEDSDTTYIYEGVKIGRDTVIHPNTTIKSDCVIGEDCELGPNAYIREKCVLADKVKIGNCVEIKKTTVAYGSKVPHLSYMGDCEIGTGVNIGCGSITCNYDGVNKHKTIIGDDCFIGSNTNLVAPVKLGNNVLVAAGSTITEDVPEDSLAIARQRQTVKEGWNSKK